MGEEACVSCEEGVTTARGRGPGNFVGHIIRSADNFCYSLVCFDKTKGQ